MCCSSSGLIQRLIGVVFPYSSARSWTTSTLSVAVGAFACAIHGLRFLSQLLVLLLLLVRHRLSPAASIPVKAGTAQAAPFSLARRRILPTAVCCMVDGISIRLLLASFAIFILVIWSSVVVAPLVAFGGDRCSSSRCQSYQRPEAIACRPSVVRDPCNHGY